MSIQELNNISFYNNLDPKTIFFMSVLLGLLSFMGLLMFSFTGLPSKKERIPFSVLVIIFIIAIISFYQAHKQINLFDSSFAQFLQSTSVKKAVLIEYTPEKHELTISENGKIKTIDEAQNGLNSPIKIRLDSDKTYVEYKEVSGLTNWRSALNGEYDIVIHTFAGSQLSKAN